MKISEIISETTSSGCIASVNTPVGGKLENGQFFGGDMNSSIYGNIKKNRERRKDGKEHSKQSKTIHEQESPER
jgi:hypothetical protein